MMDNSAYDRFNDDSGRAGVDDTENKITPSEMFRRARDENYFRPSEQRIDLPVTAAYMRESGSCIVWNFVNRDDAITHLRKYAKAGWALAWDGAVKEYGHMPLQATPCPVCGGTGTYIDDEPAPGLVVYAVCECQMTDESEEGDK